jgi:hypothetical protein
MQLVDLTPDILDKLSDGSSFGIHVEAEIPILLERTLPYFWSRVESVQV